MTGNLFRFFGLENSAISDLTLEREPGELEEVKEEENLEETEEESKEDEEEMETDLELELEIATEQSTIPANLERLWSFACDLTKGLNVSSLAWNKANPVSPQML